jgi:outer membrane protein assembly factor BamB
MAVDSERLYVVWGSVRLVAYDLATGQLLWQADVAEMRAPPVVTVCGERRLCLLNRNRVDTYDSASGDVITKTELGQKGDVTLYPVYDGQHTLYVFLNSDQGYFLVSLDLQANWQNWSKPIPYIDYPPTVSKGTLYVPGARPRKLLALEASTGRKIWEGSFDSDILQTPVIFHDLLYVRDYSGVIHVISPNDGKKLGSLNTQPFGVAGFIGVDKFAIRPVVLNEQIMIIPSGSEVRGYTTKGD